MAQCHQTKKAQSHTQTKSCKLVLEPLEFSTGDHAFAYGKQAVTDAGPRVRTRRAESTDTDPKVRAVAYTHGWCARVCVCVCLQRVHQHRP